MYLIILEKYGESLPYIKESIAIHKKLNNTIGLESGYYTLARAYHNLERFEIAIEYYKKCINLSEKINNSALIYSRYSSISKAYQDIGNNAKALEYYKLYHNFLLERKDLKAVKKMSELESKLKYEKQWALDSIRLKVEENKRVSELQNKTKTTILYYVIASTAFVAFILILFLIYKQRTLNAERLAHQKEIKNFELRQELIEKNKKVSSLLAESISHLNEKEKLTQNLKKISNSEEDRVLLKTVLRDLNVDKLEDNRALLIKQDIEKLNDSFLQKIQNKHGDLTKTELEISLLIALGLSRKDIAKLRGTTENAVKTTRKRIRKKLNINSSITLENYFQNL